MNLENLKKSLEAQKWYSEMGVDNFGRVVVYVKYMDKDIWAHVPDTVDASQVLIHFVSSKNASRDNFVEKLQWGRLPAEDDELSVDYLRDQLMLFERQCGKATLRDLFHEVHDSDDGVTNFSVVFPSVFHSMKKLYNSFGFDVLAEELGIN